MSLHLIHIYVLWEGLQHLVKVLLKVTENFAVTLQPVRQAPKCCRFPEVLIFKLNPFS